jgi:AsmA-like C-terminal region
MIESVPRRSPSNVAKTPLSRRVLWAAAACLVIAALGWILLTLFWPFTREKVQADLGEATGSTVVIKSLHKTFFPPGCVMNGVTFTPLQNGQARASVQIQQLTIRSSYSRLLSKHVDMIVDGAVANLPSAGQATGFRFNSQTNAIVDELGVKNSAVLFQSQPNASQHFDIHDLFVKHPGTREEMPFEIKLHIPEPPGELQVSGKLGRWRSDDSAQTPLSGTYSLQRADLGVFKGISGNVSSDGHFDGNIQHIQLMGSVDTPDFAVARSGHKVHVTGDYRATVNGTNGNVALEEIHAAFAKSTVESGGRVEGNRGKTADLKLASRNGRIQDVLMLFITSPVSPITGNVVFDARAKVPGTLHDFVRKVQFTSDFTIANGHLTNPNTQDKMDHLSQQAQGEKQTDDPATAISNLTGHVELRDGVANFTDLKFRVPGALAHLHGTYDVITEKVDMRGLLLMQADLPHATSGFKSFLLKPINVFLRKNRRGGARIPVTITGTYDKPVCKTDPM